MNYKITPMDLANFLLVNTSGVMNSGDFIAMAKDILNHPECLKDGNIIFDHSYLEFRDVSLDELQKIRQFHMDNEEKIGKGKTAIIVKSGLAKKWYKLWSQGERIKTENKVKVFENYNDAVNWIVEEENK